MISTKRKRMAHTGRQATIHDLGEEEKGTGYFSDVFNGRPRLLSVDSNPNAAAIVACHSSKRDNGDILNFRRKNVQGTISWRVAGRFDLCLSLTLRLIPSLPIDPADLKK
jgi:hypothetical protein